MSDNQKKILIVDDDPEIREIISDIASELGYGSIKLGNALAVIRTIRKENPVLITLDIRMPGADGLQIIRTLKREKIDIPVIVISGNLYDESAEQLIKLGIKNIMSKPFDVMRFAAMMEKILAE